MAEQNDIDDKKGKFRRDDYLFSVSLLGTNKFRYALKSGLLMPIHNSGACCTCLFGSKKIQRSKKGL